jgi:hypothetical protein
MTAVATMASGVPKFLVDARTAPRIAAVLAFVAFVSVRLAAVGPPGGDEPHFLLVAQSLLKDGDLKIANNYERQDYSGTGGGSWTRTIHVRVPTASSTRGTHQVCRR